MRVVWGVSEAQAGLWGGDGGLILAGGPGGWPLELSPAHAQLFSSSPSGSAGAALDRVDPRAFEQPILESEALLLSWFMLRRQAAV